MTSINNEYDSILSNKESTPPDIRSFVSSYKKPLIGFGLAALALLSTGMSVNSKISALEAEVDIMERVNRSGASSSSIGLRKEKADPVLKPHGRLLVNKVVKNGEHLCMDVHADVWDYGNQHFVKDINFIPCSK